MVQLKDLIIKATQILANSSPSAELDAEVLLCWQLNKNRSYLRAWPERTIPLEQVNAYLNNVYERKDGKPIAYLTGTREFWSREFLVNPYVLIPRPETELLIEQCLKRLSDKPTSRLIDLGTGSGIIAITLALECNHAQICAVDASPEALNIARQNAERQHADRICFYLSDWFTDVPKGFFDLVVSNPPYIAEHDPHLQQGDVRFEPKSALIADQNGLGDLQNIAYQARKRLKKDGYLVLEHGYQQKKPLQAKLAELGYHDIQTFHDLSGQPRVTIGLWQG